MAVEKGQITVDLTPQLKKAAAKLAHARHMTVTGYLRSLIERDLSEQTPHMKRKVAQEAA